MIAPHIAAWALNKRNSDAGAGAGDHAHDVVATHITNINDTKRKHKRPRSKPSNGGDDDNGDDTRERVLETKGGGGYQPPPQPSPKEQAEARDWEAKQDFEREQRRQEAIDAKDAIKKEAADTAWMSGKNAAYQGALTGGTSKLQGLGLSSGDDYGVYDQFTNRINTANQSLAPGADYSGAFSPTILDELLGSARTGQRNKYNTAFSSQISPYFGEDQFGSTSDDAILSSILDQQYGDAMTDLEASRARGSTNQATYDRALRDLDRSKATANTDLQNIGRGVLEDIQGDIGTRRQAALDQAANWDFGTSYDPTAEANRIRSYAGERKGGLEGELRGAVGGKEFFDINSILGKAAAKVGNQSTGTGTSALYDTFENEATRKDETTRANEGTF
jgi:hypothetical protein